MNQQLPSKELLPCPFCGEAAAMNRADDGYEEGPPYYVSCNECESDGAWKDNEEEARAAWNRRISL